MIPMGGGHPGIGESQAAPVSVSQTLFSVKSGSRKEITQLMRRECTHTRMDLNQASLGEISQSTRWATPRTLVADSSRGNGTATASRGIIRMHQRQRPFQEKEVFELQLDPTIRVHECDDII
jgi:hypothetical protein